MHCFKCNGCCVKKGVRNGKQRYRCKKCNTYQIENYERKRVREFEKREIKRLNSESVSIRGISRILGLSPSTVQRWIFRLSKLVNQPVLGEFGQEYEIDEICTYIGKNEPEFRAWITYAINKKTRDVVGVSIGCRGSKSIRKVTEKLIDLYPRVVFSDRLPVYSKLLPLDIHCTKRFRTNQIERSNLTVRNRLKRLSRKTLSYSKSLKMLEASVLLFFDEINWSFRS